MQRQAVLKALIKQSEQPGFPQQDANTRILVAASLEILKQVAAELGCPQFDMGDDNDKAFLLKAVSEVDPNAELEENDRAVVRLLDTVGEKEEIW